MVVVIVGASKVPAPIFDKAVCAVAIFDAPFDTLEFIPAVYVVGSKGEDGSVVSGPPVEPADMVIVPTAAILPTTVADTPS